MTRRSLLTVIKRPGARFILEVKKASPSQGAIRPNGDPTALARGYAGVADALSVLTDQAFFGGSLADLTAARAAFDGPLLAKDFFLDLRQVAEARMAGADAILVMLSLLDDTEARAMIAEARRFGMDALVEVHDEREMRRALALGAPLIGINNRDLRDLSIDLGTTERLAGLARGRALISESGIANRRDVDRLSGLVDAFLVGTALMRSEDPALAARELIFGRVKLCGLNRAGDFTAARPASHVGLVFVPESPRAVSISQAMRLTGLHDRLVGVFRNAPPADVGDCATLLGLAAVQLHGDEDAAYVRALARRLPAGCEVWKALWADACRSDFDAADRLVFDSGAGGTGQSFDWDLIGNHARLSQSLIAGGIGRHNAQAAQQLGAYAIDAGSKLDRFPGRKCPDKVAALFEALRPPSRQEMRLCA
jgi:indole-3-glycerol phosphate synthase/phosphoribosylanthranilate isomerase